jgi:hypothetical protein
VLMDDLLVRMLRAVDDVVVGHRDVNMGEELDIVAPNDHVRVLLRDDNSSPLLHETCQQSSETSRRLFYL